MARIPLTLQLYSLRDDCKNDLPGTLASVAEMGFEGVEFAGYYGYEAHELQRMLSDLGLLCSGVHTALPTVQGDELRRTAEFCATLGTPHLIVPYVSPDEYGGADGAKRLGDALSQAAEAAKPFGARVGYHNHAWEFQALPDGRVPMDLIFENASPDVIAQIDTGNAQEGGGDPAPIIEKYKNRVVTAHLKPFAADFSRYFVGEDDTDWQRVFNALEGDPDNVATQYYIVEQERYPDGLSPKECVARCLKNLKEMGK